MSDKVKNQLQRVIGATAGELREAEAKAFDQAEAQQVQRRERTSPGEKPKAREPHVPGVATGLGTRVHPTRTAAPQEHPVGAVAASKRKESPTRADKAQGQTHPAPAVVPASATASGPSPTQGARVEPSSTDSAVASPAALLLPRATSYHPHTAQSQPGGEEHAALVQGLVRELREENSRLRSQMARMVRTAAQASWLPAPLTVHVPQTEDLEAEVAAKEKRLQAVNKQLEDQQGEDSTLRAELMKLQIHRDTEKDILYQFVVSLYKRHGLESELASDLRGGEEKGANGGASAVLPLPQVIASVEKVIKQERTRADELETGLAAAQRRVSDLEELNEARKSQIELHMREFEELNEARKGQLELQVRASRGLVHHMLPSTPSSRYAASPHVVPRREPTRRGERQSSLAPVAACTGRGNTCSLQAPRERTSTATQWRPLHGRLRAPPTQPCSPQLALDALGHLWAATVRPAARPGTARHPTAGLRPHPKMAAVA